MKIPWTAIAICAFCTLVTMPLIALPPVSNKKTSVKSRYWNPEIESLVRERVSHLKLPFNVAYEQEITDNIREYVTYGIKDSELILGRTKLYFPLFEHNLKLNHLPQELKYLPIIESKLNPTIKSPVGAAGLWQFVPATARLFGLKMNGHIDERLDPYRSTEAATALLKKLYAEYCDWAVVLAAYNCGTVRVNKAIKTAGSTKYNDIKKYLPTETRKYIPRYVAAAYLANYFDEHRIEPKIRSYQFGEIRTLKIKEQISFSKIVEITELDSYAVHKLNPGYLKKFIPESKSGSYLTLPADALKKVAFYLKSKKESSAYLTPKHAFQKNYIVQVGESVEHIAERFGCQESEIMAWNNLNQPNVNAHQQIYLYFKPEIKWTDA